MRAAVAVLVLSMIGCPGEVPFHDYAKEPDPRSRELVLGVGDVVGINVWEQKDLNIDATIRPDGTITMPLVGDLKAAGETPSSLNQTIKARLKDFLKLQGTEITVAVKAWKSYRFTVQGEVTRQGVFTSDGYVTVADGLAMAGGLSRWASRTGIRVFRTDPKTKKVRQIPIDYDALTSGKRLDMNIWILPGDIISVP
jgi:polysaccharide biosynthesis/export protein